MTNDIDGDREEVRKFIRENSLADMKKVREYLDKNPLASVMDVSMKTGVPTGAIMSLVNAGVLKIKEAKK
jgi:hypothetical protein